MLRFISNIPIFRRLFLAFVLAAIIPGVIITILGSTFVNGLEGRSLAQQENIEAVNASNNLGNLLFGMDSVRNELVLKIPTNFSTYQQMGHGSYSDLKLLEQHFDTQSAQFQQNYQVATASSMSAVNSALANDNPSEQLPQKQQTYLSHVLDQGGLWQTYKVANDKVLQDIQSPTANATQLSQDNLVASQDLVPLRQAWSNVIAVTQQISTVLAQVGPSQIDPIILVTVIAFVSTILVVIAIGYLVNITITTPLRDLALLTRRIARGDTEARAQIGGHDEIHMVANSMNNMLDNIVHLIQDTQAQRDVLQSQVEKLVSEVSGVGDGDLSIQAEVTADALGVLADSFNYMVEELGGLVVRVKKVASEVDNSTVTILERMTQLVKSGDEQIRQISQAALEIEHMSADSRHVAERSQVLYDVARVAREDANGGRDAVRQAIEGMGRINENVQLTANKVQDLGERSREIDEIVNAINSIAHQTNRLALDAAIQAAMAGENGKGFGAVAADIRRLAERAKEQVSSVTKIVRNVREDVGAVAISMQDTERETLSGTRLTQEAGVALESIFTAVERQAREIENINNVAMQQLQSSSAVVQIMHNVSDATQQSSGSTREASQNMQRLARLVEQLRSSVEAFKLRHNQSYYLSNMDISMESEDNQLSVSGVFRTVSGSGMPQLPSQLSPVRFVPNALPAANTEDSFSFPPSTPGFFQGTDNYDLGFNEQDYNEQQRFLSNGNTRAR